MENTLNPNIDVKGPRQAVVAGTYYVDGVPSLNGNAEPQFTVDGRHFIGEVPREIVVENHVYDQPLVRRDGRYTYTKRNPVNDARFVADAAGNGEDTHNPVVNLDQIKKGDRVCIAEQEWITVKDIVFKRPSNVMWFKGVTDAGHFRSTYAPTAHMKVVPYGKPGIGRTPLESKTAEHEFTAALKLLHSEAPPNRALRTAALHYVKRTNGSSGHELSE